MNISRLVGWAIAYNLPDHVTYRGHRLLQIGVIVFDYASMPFNFWGRDYRREVRGQTRPGNVP